MSLPNKQLVHQIPSLKRLFVVCLLLLLQCHCLQLLVLFKLSQTLLPVLKHLHIILILLISRLFLHPLSPLLLYHRLPLLLLLLPQHRLKQLLFPDLLFSHLPLIPHLIPLHFPSIVILIPLLNEEHLLSLLPQCLLLHHLLLCLLGKQILLELQLSSLHPLPLLLYIFLVLDDIMGNHLVPIVFFL